MNLSLIVMIVWFSAAIFVPILALADFDATVRLYYSNAIQTFSALFSAGLCYYASLGYSKDNPVRWVWIFLSIAMICWLVGNIIYTAYPLLHDGAETPIVYYSDIGYLGFNIFLIIALFTLKNALDITPPLWGKLLTLFICLAIFIFSFVGDQSALLRGELTPVISLIYDISELIFIGIAVWVASGLVGGSVGGLWWFVVAGLLCYHIGNKLYTYLSEAGQYTSGSLVDFLWIIGFYLVGVAAIKQRLLFIGSR